MWNPQLRTKKYKIENDEYDLIKNASWYPFKSESAGSGLSVCHGSLGVDICEKLPDSVSSADWSYCMFT